MGGVSVVGGVSQLWVVCLSFGWCVSVVGGVSNLWVVFLSCGWCVSVVGGVSMCGWCD